MDPPFKVAWRYPKAPATDPPDVQLYTKVQMQQLLAPATLILPRNFALRLDVASLLGLGQEETPWDLTTVPGIRGALDALMPGDFAPSYLLMLAQHAADKPVGKARWTSAKEVKHLLQNVDLSRASTYATPWGGSALVNDRMREAGLYLHHNIFRAGAGMTTHPALAASTYNQAGPSDVYIMAPWIMWLDLALPLAVAFARMVTCVLVPTQYLTARCTPRQRYLRQLQQQDRVIYLPSPQLGENTDAGQADSVWVIIFASSLLRESMTGYQSLGGWIRC